MGSTPRAAGVAVTSRAGGGSWGERWVGDEWGEAGLYSVEGGYLMFRCCLLGREVVEGKVGCMLHSVITSVMHPLLTSVTPVRLVPTWSFSHLPSLSPNVEHGPYPVFLIRSSYSPSPSSSAEVAPYRPQIVTWTSKYIIFSSPINTLL